VYLHDAVTDRQQAADLLAGVALHRAGGDFSFAYPDLGFAYLNT